MLQCLYLVLVTTVRSPPLSSPKLSLHGDKVSWTLNRVVKRTKEEDDGTLNRCWYRGLDGGIAVLAAFASDPPFCRVVFVSLHKVRSLAAIAS